MKTGTPLAPSQHVGDVSCAPVWSGDDLAIHFAIRRAIFVGEQRLFAVTDVDGEDDKPETLHVLGRYRGVAAGTVRLFPMGRDRRTWQGDRLSVLADFRSHGLGGPLVRCATACAAERGGVEMLAHIQVANVRFFEHLGWHRHGDVELYVGVPHQPMRIDLVGLPGVGAPPVVAGGPSGRGRDDRAAGPAGAGSQ